MFIGFDFFYFSFCFLYLDCFILYIILFFMFLEISFLRRRESVDSSVFFNVWTMNFWLVLKPNKYLFGMITTLLYGGIVC